MSVAWHLFFMLLCLAGVAFFAGAESGVLCVSRVRLMHFVRNGLKPAIILARYLDDMQHFVVTVLVGCNLANVILSTLSARVALTLFPGHPLAQTLWACAVVCMVLFFSEYLPKLFFTTRPLRRTLLVMDAFRVMDTLLYPVTRLVSLLTSWFVPANAHAQQSLITREFIQDVVSDPKDGAQITPMERLMINRVLDLQSQAAAQVMTPLDKVASLTEDDPLTTCFDTVRAFGNHARLPVFSADAKRCVGVFTVLDVFAIRANIRHATVNAFMRPPLFVSPDMKADDLLPLMRKNRQHMAIVRGPAGDVLGIITEEDILNILTGNLG
ncbi:MAG: CNNM domain-containing protein [Kiritimatiellaeota bacterium]|nr:CNNM domain-containing protein [Kiritimatiellota bacterium]